MKRLLLLSLIALIVVPVFAAQPEEESLLMHMATEQLHGLIALELQMTFLTERAVTLSGQNSELASLINEANETITQLRWDLEVAIDRIGDAEDGAIFLLMQNQEMYEEARLLVTRVRQLEQQLRASRIAGPSFGFVFGIGSTMAVTGAINDHQMQTYIGGGIALTSGVVYILGKYVFSWW